MSGACWSARGHVTPQLLDVCDSPDEFLRALASTRDLIRLKVHGILAKRLQKLVLVQPRDFSEQILINLLDNAIKFSRVYATITLEITQNESESCICVKNEGSGFDENTALHIFDKFYQGDTSHSAKGNGLGLTLVKRIVEMHGGRITVESVPDVETVFKVYLPGR